MSFVGRRADLETLHRLIEQGERLITIVGPGGIGKTRLAREYTRAHRADFEADGGGTWFCDLVDARDLRSLCAAVARDLGVTLGAGETDAAAAERLGPAIGVRGSSLLVLDNFEQVIEHAAGALGQWLAAAPEVCFVVTSRERLRLPGEATLELAPLSLPAEGADAATVRASEAVTLLSQCVRRQRSEFAPTPAETAILADVVRQLDGIPLAIELAAARMALLGPAAVLERLRDRFELLGHGPRDASARQRTLRGAIDWSWDLLEPHERSALAQCSVFRGGFSVDAAEAVIDLSSHRGAPPVLEVLQSLRDKSLLLAADAADLPGELRLGTYLGIRDYAAEKLAAGDPAATAATELRHAEHYLRSGEALADAVDGPDGTTRLRRLMLEQENLVEIVSRALAAPKSPGAATRAMRALVILEVVLSSRGLYHLQTALLDAALAAFPKKNTDAILRARVLDVRGRTLGTQGRFEEAVADLEAALALAKKAGDRKLVGRITAALGRGVWHEPARAMPYLEKALAIHREVGDRRFEAITEDQIAASQHAHGKAAEARAGFERALRIFREVGDLRWTAMCLCQLGTGDLEEWRTEEARARFAEAAAIGPRVVYWGLEAFVSQSQALLCHVADGRPIEAIPHYERAVAVCRRVANRPFEGMYLGYLGIAHRELGDLPRALEHLGRARTILEEVGERRHLALFRAHLAAIDAGRGRVDEAAAEMHAAEAVLGGLREGEGRTETPILASIRVERGHVELARAVRAAAAGDDAAATTDRAAARARLAAAAESARHSLDVRLSVRLLEAALLGERRLEPALPGVGAGEQGNPGALLVHRDGRWYRPPHADVVSCRTRHTVRRLVLHLAAQRLQAPGTPTSMDDLLAAGWPGERILPAAARNRLHVALATLRKLGLRDVLLSHGDGYLFDPEVPCHLVSTSTASGMAEA